MTFFLTHHRPCLGGPVDRVACPPSTQQDAGIQDVVAMFGRTFPGNVDPLRWRNPAARTYDVDPRVRGQRILLVDDTFTSGVRTRFPAVEALTSRGATVVGPVVLGRRFRREYGENEWIWRQLRPAEYDETKCGRCDDYRFDPPLRPTGERLFP